MRDTEKTQAQLIQELQALRQRNAELEQARQALFVHLPIPVFTKNREGVYTSCNAENQKYWAVNPVGHTDAELLDPETAATLREADLRVMETGDTLTLEEVLTHTPLGARHVLTRKVPLRNSNGEIIGILGASLDITKRKQAEHALQESEELFRTAINTSPSCIFIKDLEGRYLLVNTTIANLYDATPQAMLGKSDVEFALQHRLTQAEAEKFFVNDRQVIQTRTAKFIPEEAFSLPDGSTRWFQTTKIPISLSGRTDCMLGIAVDITERKQIEAELRLSETRLRQTINLVPHQIFVRNLQGRYLVVNQAAAAHRGITPEQMEGKCYDELPGGLAQEFPEYLRSDREVIRSGQRQYIAEQAFTLPDQAPRWFDINKIPYPMPTTEEPAVLVVGIDVTERKQAEAALRESEELFRTMFEEVPVGIAFADIQTSRLIRVNPAFCQLFGYTEDELHRMTIADISYPEDLPENTRLFEQAVTQAGSPDYRMEKRYVTRTGELVWAKLLGTIMRDDKGNPIYRVGILEDITERKQAEQALRESEARFKAIFEYSASALFVVDADKRIAEVNDEACRLLEYAKDELRGKSYLAITHPDDVERSKQEVLKIDRRQADTIHLEKRYLTKTGTIIHAFVSVAPVFEDGGLDFYIAQIVDITALKRAERKLQQANATKDAFFSIIGHDLKGPLSGILKGTELLLEYLQLDDRRMAQKIGQQVHDSVQQVSDLLDNLLTWARTQQKRITYQPEAINLTASVAHCASLLQASAAQKEITFSSSIPEALHVYADYQMLMTMLRNLISNAIKFTLAGGKVTISAHKQHGMVEITVSDTGVGMSEEKVQRLFKIDERNISSNGTAGEHGTGLGLILCQEFVSYHGGAIWAESRQGEGSTFRFTLPLATS